MALRRRLAAAVVVLLVLGLGVWVVAPNLTPERGHMRSGYENYDGIWGNEYYEEEFAEIADRVFTQRTLVSGDALVSKSPLSPEELPEDSPARVHEDGTVLIPYVGQPFDSSEFALVKGEWDHEHCGVCRYSIGDGETFWVNASGDILCDACHDHYLPAD